MKDDTSRYGIVRKATRGEIGEAIAMEDIKRGDLVVGKAPEYHKPIEIIMRWENRREDDWIVQERLQKRLVRADQRFATLLGAVFMAVFIGLLVVIFSVIQTPDAHAQGVTMTEKGVYNDITITATVTAYTSSEDETDNTPFETASGSQTHDGVAACPRQYAFGTRVRIAGREYLCEDRMNAKYADRFDIWVASKAEAFEFGKQRVEVAIIN